MYCEEAGHEKGTNQKTEDKETSPKLDIDMVY